MTASAAEMSQWSLTVAERPLAVIGKGNKRSFGKQVFDLKWLYKAFRPLAASGTVHEMAKIALQ